MRRQLVITDLTRMQHGRVCLAGYDANGQCIRPGLPPPGISEQGLIVDGQPVAYPFAIVGLDLLCPRPQPPHTEDWDFDPASIKFIRRVKDENRARVFDGSLFDSVSAIFEQPIHDDLGHYVQQGCGPRSIGTIRPRSILRVIYEKGPAGVWDYRLVLVDGDDAMYRLKIVDLTWHYYCDSLRGASRDPAQIAAGLTATRKSSAVYIRIGLSRGWAQFPDRCYLQITGLHTTPDYLGGQTFADFAPKQI